MGPRTPPRRSKGTPKTGGRRKGTPNKTTVEAREAAAEIVDNPIYRANLTKRALAGTLSPPIEQMLWHYAKGRPKETIGLEGGITVETDRHEVLMANFQKMDTELLRKLVALDEENREKQRALMLEAGIIEEDVMPAADGDDPPNLSKRHLYSRAG